MVRGCGVGGDRAASILFQGWYLDLKVPSIILLVLLLELTNERGR